MELDAVVLAGGGGRRLGGVDKAGLDVGGVTLLDRVLTACAAAGRTVVVGRERPTVRPVAWALETPPGGGPLAGLVAGMARLGELGPERSCPVLVLATDLPRLGADDVARLGAALDGATDDVEAALFADAGGRLQLLAGAYRRGPLRRVLAGEKSGTGRSMRILAESLRLVTVDDLGAATDCDTAEQLAQHRAQPTRHRAERSSTDG